MPRVAYLTGSDPKEYYNDFMSCERPEGSVKANITNAGLNHTLYTEEVVTAAENITIEEATNADTRTATAAAQATKDTNWTNCRNKMKTFWKGDGLTNCTNAELLEYEERIVNPSGA